MARPDRHGRTYMQKIDKAGWYDPVLYYGNINLRTTLLQKRKEVWFWFPTKIRVGGEILGEMLPENDNFKKIYRGTYTSDVQKTGCFW